MLLVKFDVQGFLGPDWSRVKWDEHDVEDCIVGDRCLHYHSGRVLGDVEICFILKQLNHDLGYFEMRFSIGRFGYIVLNETKKRKIIKQEEESELEEPEKKKRKKEPEVPLITEDEGVMLEQEGDDWWSQGSAFESKVLSKKEMRKGRARKSSFQSGHGFNVEDEVSAVFPVEFEDCTKRIRQRRS